MIPDNKKRITITIPKDWDRLILKGKEYALGENMNTSFLFCYLLLKHLWKEGYLSGEEYNNQFRKWFFLDYGNK